MLIAVTDVKQMTSCFDATYFSCVIFQNGNVNSLNGGSQTQCAIIGKVSWGGGLALPPNTWSWTMLFSKTESAHGTYIYRNT